VSTSLRLGDAVLVVATSDHRDQLVSELENTGSDVRANLRDGRYTMLDAKETLSTFMVNGRPDPNLFSESIGHTLASMRNRTRNRSQGLTVFGEMVAVLWDEDKKIAALELEKLWNNALNQRAFHLHCAYPRSGFVNHTDLDAVCVAHSHVLQ
jgi:hypothetical protein